MYDNEVQKNAPRIIRAAIRQATRGDSRALVDVLNRVLGPPSQRLEVTGPGGAPLALQAAAPVALALMSTEELRALLGLQRRLGLPDVQVQAVRDLIEARPSDPAAGALEPAAEPGQIEPLSTSSLLDSTSLPLPVHPDPLDPDQDDPSGLRPATPNPEPDTPAGDQVSDEGGDEGPARASNLPGPAGGGQVEGVDPEPVQVEGDSGPNLSASYSDEPLP